MDSKFKLLFICLFSTCLHSRAVLSSPTNLGDLDRQLEDEADRIKRNIPSTEDFLLQENGKSDDSIDSEERNKRGLDAHLNEDQQFVKREADEGDDDSEDDIDESFDGRDKRGLENLDDSDYDQDEADEDEILQRARKNSESADKVQGGENENKGKRAVGGDAKEDDDDDDDDDVDQDDLSDIAKRDIYDDLDDDEDEEDFAKKRKKRSTGPTPATPPASLKKDIKASKNVTCKSQRSLTLSDLDKLLSVADDDDDDTEEAESRNRRNMEAFFDEDDEDDYDDDDERAETLSRNRRDVDDEDDEDDDDSEDLSRQARDLEDEDDDDDDDEKEEVEDERKRRETDVDDEDDDEEDDDSDINNLVRMLRDTKGDEEKQDDEDDDDDDFGEKIQSVATRDLSTSDVSEDATENQQNSYEASNDNPAENVNKREADYDYDEEDLNSNNGQQLEKREKDKTRTKPFFTNLVIDEPEDFSISEQGDSPSVTINDAGMKTRYQRPSRGHNKLNLIVENTHSFLDTDTKKPSYSTTIYNEKKPVYHDNGKYKSNLKHQKRRLKSLHSNSNYNDNSIMSKDEKTRRESSDVSIPDNTREPRGPIAMENKLNKLFAGMFEQTPKADIQWVEPDMLANCWVHAMLAHSFGNGFSPSCNMDGTYSAKQCFLQRCWCVNRDGSPQDPYFDTRFFYAVKGAMHSCIQVS